MEAATATTSTMVRTRLLDELRLDLIGPHAADELLSDRPTVQYLTGMLYPSGVEPDPAEDDSLETAGSDEEDGDEQDSPAIRALSQTMNPTSIGLSFAVISSISTISVNVSYGLYNQQSIEVEPGKMRSGWQRRQITESIPIPLHVGNAKRSLEGGGSLEWVVRPAQGNVYSVSLFLVNRNIPSDLSRVDDSQCLFQPHLLVHGESGDHPFIHRTPGGTLPPDADLESYRLLYRDCYEFAVGHGCAVDWAEIREDRAGSLETSLIPSYELPATVPGSMSGLEMKALAEARTPAQITLLLEPLFTTYDQWIVSQRTRIPTLQQSLQSTAVFHLDRCSEALKRMREGLTLIQTDSEVLEAFRFANRAMLLQRSHIVWSQDYRRTGKRNGVHPPLEGSWRPFQIAFILLNLPGVVKPDSDQRDIVDLLWFPTGGGKTEAYLGLAAFTMALRRLRKHAVFEGDGGITIIMRYTLRLLTTQQFQRAATLICACEYLRRQDTQRWGKSKFLIGLWVGSGATPNTLADAAEALDKLRNGGQVKEGNPMQLPACPWCGTKLTAWSYHIDSDRDRLVIACPREVCEFHARPPQLEKALPVLLVDEAIYHQCPTLLLATVDKFARLPWKPQTAALFGRVEQYCPRHGYLVSAEQHSQTHRAAGRMPAVNLIPCKPFLPPDLIIQDELHLISGPLGTLMGLYETAIDLLCGREAANGTLIRPKVIASTATIRRAEDQVRNLFARDVRLFPPSGIDVGDSFFASVKPLSEQPGRCYVGIYAAGRSVKTALVRVYAILLQAAGELLKQNDPNADPYFTLVGYFNSLRELGGALRLVEDDIVQRLEYLATQRQQPARQISTENCELTSRIPSYKIPEILELLEHPAGSSEALDVLLATNMISVGVDVNRLGLMVVNGQPKASAEYIQATSRVGRRADAPGLVITVYNWSRPRDISHYERFRPYHEAIYRHVEATSVTPFAPRARDRALHAVLIALARLLQSTWAENAAAGSFDPKHPKVERFLTRVQKRVTDIDPGALNEVTDQLTMLLDWWKGLANHATTHEKELHYQGNPYKPNESEPVLMHLAEERRSGGSRPTLNSLREVEAESRLFINLTN